MQTTIKKKRRVFSIEQKHLILKEATASSICGTAMKYRLNPAQVFVWRKLMMKQQTSQN